MIPQMHTEKTYSKQNNSDTFAAPRDMSSQLRFKSSQVRLGASQLQHPKKVFEKGRTHVMTPPRCTDSTDFHVIASRAQ